MRFGAAHEVSTYLMATCALAALALSGELSAAAVALGALGLIASCFFRPASISPSHLTRTANAAAAVALAIELARAAVTGDALLSGARFLLVLLVVVLFSRRASRHYAQIYVITFLIFVAATVLNPGVTFGLAFLGYVVAATWALMILRLRRDIEDHVPAAGAGGAGLERLLRSRRVVGPKFLAGAALVSLSIFAVSTAVFFAIPRVGFGLMHDEDRSRVQMAGFSDEVSLGGHGVIRDDPSVIMRVELEDGQRTEALPPIRWRGVAHDHYEDGRWRRTRDAPRTQGARSRRGDTSRFALELGGRGPAGGQLGAFEDGALRQRIYLEPLSRDVLFGAAQPGIVEVTGPEGDLRGGRNDELRYPHGSGVAYTVYSDLGRPDPDALRAAPSELPEGYDVYLQLPDELPERIVDLAREITEGAETDYDKVVALEAWLGDLGYTRELASPGGDEPLEHFLFERREGHCEYFASALAVLARAVGVPTRNVNGFLGGEWNDFADYLAVRAGDAHSWVEVYFHGVGWVSFDPTPASGAPGQGEGAGGFGETLRRFADSLRFQWFRWVIDYDLDRQMGLFEGLADGVRGGADAALARPVERARGWVSERRETVAAGAAFGAALLAGALLWRRRAGRPARGRGGRRGGVEGIYDAACARLRRRGYPRAPERTPREHARELADRGAPGADAYAELVELYYLARYGGDDDSPARERAETLHVAIERALKEKAGRTGRTPRGARDPGRPPAATG